MTSEHIKGQASSVDEINKPLLSANLEKDLQTTKKEPSLKD